MKRYFFLFVFVGLISGCGTPPARHLVVECQRKTAPASGARFDCLNRASIKTEELQKQAHSEGIMRRCESFGMAKGTPNFNQCVFQQNQIEIQNKAAAQSLRMQQEQHEMQQMQQAIKMLSPPIPANPVITCTRFPGSFTTTCQ